MMIIGDGVMEYIMDRVYARELLERAYKQNPGPWYKNSIHVAQATENIILKFISVYRFLPGVEESIYTDIQY